MGAFENPKIKVKSQEVLVRPWSNKERREKKERTLKKMTKFGSIKLTRKGPWLTIPH